MIWSVSGDLRGLLHPHRYFLGGNYVEIFGHYFHCLFMIRYEVHIRCVLIRMWEGLVEVNLYTC